MPWRKEVYLSCNTLLVGGDKTKVSFYYDSQLENLAAENNSINLITPMEMRVRPRALFSCGKGGKSAFADDISEDFLMDGSSERTARHRGVSGFLFPRTIYGRLWRRR